MKLTTINSIFEKVFDHETSMTSLKSYNRKARFNTFDAIDDVNLKIID